MPFDWLRRKRATAAAERTPTTRQADRSGYFSEPSVDRRWFFADWWLRALTELGATDDIAASRGARAALHALDAGRDEAAMEKAARDAIRGRFQPPLLSGGDGELIIFARHYANARRAGSDRETAQGLATAEHARLKAETRAKLDAYLATRQPASAAKPGAAAPMRDPSPAPATAAPAPTAPLAPQPAGSLDTEANELIQQALAIIDDHVHIEPGALQVSGAGSEGPVAMAAATLEKAHARHASSPLLHYAYCSALAIAAQHKTARDQMELLNKAHPEYPLARWALASWDRWKSLFTVPHWAPDSRALPTALAQAVITCTLLPVRDGIEPRTALFFRDRNGDFQDLAALQAARIDITAVIDETDARAPVIGIYAQVWDDPSNALGVEAHGLAWYPRGHSIRRSYEHLCTQDNLDFVVIGANDAVLLNRRLPMPDRMKTSLSELRRLLDSDNAYEYQPNEVQTAVAAHQQRYSAGSVAY